MKLFADRHTWFEHELTCHRLEWCCRFCSYPAFATQEKLAAHMRARHTQLSSPAQLSVLLHASKQVVDRIPAADCLLCDWESVLKQNNAPTSLDETLVVTVDQFRRHVGSHMEQLALFALPRNSGEQGAEGKSNEAAAAAGSNASSLDLIEQRPLSWKSNLSVTTIQDQAVPDLPLSENRESFEDADYLPPYAWSSSALMHRPIPGQAGADRNQTTWTGCAIGQECFEKGEIYIHGGTSGRLKTEEKTYVIDMSEGKGIVSSLGRINPSAYSSSLGPGPRAYAAAVSDVSRSAFIVFGGFMGSRVDLGQYDTSLYWLDTGIFLASSDASYADHLRNNWMV